MPDRGGCDWNVHLRGNRNSQPSPKEGANMMTVVTQVTLKPGCEPEWDAAMRERLAAAKGRRGWVGGQLLIPLDGHNRRAVIGTWESRADWEAWHEDERFVESRKRMDGLQEGSSEMSWYEVVTEGRGGGTSSVGPSQ
jgi:heme-degrading monooxygenase HmoA